MLKNIVNDKSGETSSKGDERVEEIDASHDKEKREEMKKILIMSLITSKP